MFDEINEVKIAQAQDLFRDMKAEKEKYEKLSELAFKDWIETVKREVHYDDYIYLGNSAQKWTWMLKHEKLDGRRNYPEKEAFELLIEKIKTELIPADFDVIQLNNQYGVELRFSVPTTPNCQFELHIPNNSALSDMWFYESSCGQIRLNVCYNNSCCWEFVTASYQRAEIKKAFENFIKPQEVWTS